MSGEFLKNFPNLVEVVSDLWFWVTIVLPIFLPSIGAFLLKQLPIPGNPPGLHMMSTVKDGQLGWAVVVMGASSAYEASSELKGPMIGAIVLMATGMLIAAGGAVFTTPLRSANAQATVSWRSHYSVFVWSAYMTIAAALLFTFIHYGIQKHEQLAPTVNSDQQSAPFDQSRTPLPNSRWVW